MRREVKPHRHTDNANGARQDHGTLGRHEYRSLEEPAGDPAATEPQGSRDSPQDT